MQLTEEQANALKKGYKLTPSPAQLAVVRQVAETLERARMKGAPAPEDCRSADAYATKMILGLELGIPIMTAVYELMLGKSGIGMTAQLKVGLARRHRIADIDLVESTNERAVVEVRRLEWPKNKTARVEWTLEDARTAGLLGKDNWRHHPRAMLAQRCMAWGVNLHCQDAMLGLGYTYDELEMADPIPNPDITDDALPDQEAVTSSSSEAQSGPAAHGESPAPVPPRPNTPERDHVPVSPSPGPAAPPEATDGSVLARIADLVKQLGYKQAEWRAYLAGPGLGLASVRDADLGQGIMILDHLRGLARIGRLRKLIGPTDQQWREHVLRDRRGIDSEILLTD